MVRGLLSKLGSRANGLHDAAYLLASFTVLSQVLALVRDRFLAHVFGAGSVLDVYYAAFRIPDIIFVLVSSMVSLFVLVPFLAERLAEGKAEARQFLSGILSSFLFVIVIVSALAFVFMPRIAPVMFPGLLGNGHMNELVLLGRILLLSPILLGLSNLISSVTQYEERFIIYAVSPILYNIGIIIGIGLLYPAFGIAGLGAGVVLGAFLHFGVQLPTVARSGLLPRFAAPRWKDAFQVFKHSVPRTASLLFQQLSTVVLVGLASLMGVGSIAVFNFALNLQSVPLAIVGASYSVAAFPTLSKLFTAGDRETFVRHILSAARHIVFWSVPALVFFVVLRAQIVRTVLGTGAFSWDDTRLTAASLALFSISLAAQGIMLLFARGYYAAGHSKKPFIIYATTAVITVALGYVGYEFIEGIPVLKDFLESLLRVEGIPGTAVLVLPLSYSVGMLAGSIAFTVLFARDFGLSLISRLGASFFHSFSASVIGGFVAYLALNAFDDLFNLNTLAGIFGQGLLAGIVGILAWIAVLVILKNEEFAEITLAMSKQIWEARTVPVETQEL